MKTYLIGVGSVSLTIGPFNKLTKISKRRDVLWEDNTREAFAKMLARKLYCPSRCAVPNSLLG